MAGFSREGLRIEASQEGKPQVATKMSGLKQQKSPRAEARGLVVLVGMCCSYPNESSKSEDYHCQRYQEDAWNGFATIYLTDAVVINVPMVFAHRFSPAHIF